VLPASNVKSELRSWPTQLAASSNHQPGDEHFIKRRFSALIQGSSELGERLQAAGIDIVIITGTAANICCESTARDAFMLTTARWCSQTRNATVSDEAHNASLNASFIRFANVFTADEILDLVVAASGQTARRICRRAGL
jgi:ureidoacrylate peracid hydrolase